MEWHGIRPSDLQPYLGDEYSKHLGTSGSVDRGVRFEKCFLFALYGRYLLTKWKAKRADDWVPLVDVLVNAVSPGKQSLLEGIDVNLSKGVTESFFHLFPKKKKKKKEDREHEGVVQKRGTLQYNMERTQLKCTPRCVPLVPQRRGRERDGDSVASRKPKGHIDAAEATQGNS